MPDDYQKLLTWEIAGHRGKMGYDDELPPHEQIPENSFEAIEHSYKNGVMRHECDVQITKNGELYIFHDSEDDFGLNKLTNVEAVLRTDPNQISDDEFKAQFTYTTFTSEKEFKDFKAKFIAARAAYLGDIDPKGKGQVYISDHDDNDLTILRTLSHPDATGKRYPTRFSIQKAEEILNRIDKMRLRPDDGYELNIEIKRAYRFARDSDGSPRQGKQGDDDVVTFDGKAYFKIEHVDIAKYVSALLIKFFHDKDSDKWDLDKNITVSSFDKNILLKMKAANPEVPRRALFAATGVPQRWALSDDETRMELWKDGQVAWSRASILPIDKLIKGQDHPEDINRPIDNTNERIWDLTEDDLINEIKQCLKVGIAPKSIAIPAGQLTPTLAKFIKSQIYLDAQGNEHPLEICLWTANEPTIKNRMLGEIRDILDYVSDQGISTFITNYGQDMVAARNLIVEIRKRDLTDKIDWTKNTAQVTEQLKSL